MLRRLSICLCLIVALVAAGCGPAGKNIGPDTSPQAMPLGEGIKALAKGLCESSAGKPVGKITVADFLGPGSGIYVLGEHISDKVSVRLFASGTFTDFMERRQLKQVLQGLKDEHSGYFDPKTVQRFGSLIGVDSMVIGTIEDLGPVVDVTAKIIQSGTGRLLAMADVQIAKDDTVRGLLYKERTATLTVSVEPAVEGSVTAGQRQERLINGMATLKDIPYGPCQVFIQPQGYEPVRRSINIRSRTEALAVSLKSRRYDVSFQVVPPDASLTVDGQNIALNPQGYARLTDLKPGEHSFVAKAEGHRSCAGTFDPLHKTQMVINLEAQEAQDPFYAISNKLFKKVAQIAGRQDFRVELWTDKGTYRVGEPIHFYFRAERDCYLNLIDVNSRGEITVLFPNRYDSNNFVSGGVTYRIPGDSYDGFVFEALPPTGKDRIYAIASSTRSIDIFEHDFSRSVFTSLTRGNTRGIGVIGTRIDMADLNAAAMTVIDIRR